MIKKGSTISFGLDEPPQQVFERYPGLTKAKYKRIYDAMSPQQQQAMTDEDKRKWFIINDDD